MSTLELAGRKICFVKSTGLNLKAKALSKPLWTIWNRHFCSSLSLTLH